MDIKNILEKIGLNKKEADIYLACLEHGPETITSLARLSGYKRSTLYHLIEGLLQKGLIVIIRRQKRTYYDAEKPKKLLTVLRARERELTEALPKLQEIRNTKQPLPKIEIYETEEAIKNVYDEIYASFNTKEEVCFLTSVSDLQKYRPYVLDNFVLQAKKNKKYKIRELVLNDVLGKKYTKKIKKHFTHPIKLLPTDFPINNDIVLFKDKVALFAFKKQRGIVTVINDPAVTQTIKTLYEQAWQNSKIA